MSEEIKTELETAKEWWINADFLKCYNIIKEQGMPSVKETDNFILKNFRKEVTYPFSVENNLIDKSYNQRFNAYQKEFLDKQLENTKGIFTATKVPNSTKFIKNGKLTHEFKDGEKLFTAEEWHNKNWKIDSDEIDLIQNYANYHTEYHLRKQPNLIGKLKEARANISISSFTNDYGTKLSNTDFVLSQIDEIVESLTTPSLPKD